VLVKAIVVPNLHVKCGFGLLIEPPFFSLACEIVRSHSLANLLRAMCDAKECASSLKASTEEVLWLDSFAV
jgi:hypothetical protein